METNISSLEHGELDGSEFVLVIYVIISCACLAILWSNMIITACLFY